MEMQEIETKTLALYEIKRIKKGLSKEEEYCYQLLQKKYRNDKGELIKGSYYIDSNGNWVKV